MNSPSIAQGTDTVNLKASIAFTGNTAPVGAVTFTVNGASYTGICTETSNERICTATATGLAGLAAGSYPITVSEGADANFAAASATGTLTVTSRGTFELIAKPEFEVIRRGDRAEFRLDLRSLDGFSDEVRITCSGGPSGSECRDFPRKVRLEPDKRARLTSEIRFPKDTAPGTYTITFTGTSCSAVVSTTARFKVRE